MTGRTDLQTQSSPTRVGSIDAYRGLVMLLMQAEVLQSCHVAEAVPGSSFWRLICQQQTHAAWAGCTLHDLIQPGFCFLVGAALPFSIAGRRARGQPARTMTVHMLVRSLELILLGLFMTLAHRGWLSGWHLDDTLSQIGLAYPFVFLLALRPARERWVALGVVLVGCWAWFGLTSLPGPGFDYGTVGVTAEWMKEHGLSGFAAHWQKNSNPAAALDRWAMNLVPRSVPFVGAANGLTTLNFIPLIGTMLLGVTAGEALRRTAEQRRRLWVWLVGAGLAGVLSGWALGAAGICPVVKAVWTPSWVLFSGGWCFLFLAGFHAWVDRPRNPCGALLLTVPGMNSLLAYALSHYFPAFAYNSMHRVFGWRTFEVFGAAYEPAVYGLAIMGFYWLFLYALYKRRLFLRL